MGRGESATSWRLFRKLRLPALIGRCGAPSRVGRGVGLGGAFFPKGGVPPLIEGAVRAYDRTMKVAIVHDSQAGNGEKLAMAMKEGFEAWGASVILGHVDRLDPKEVAASKPDLLVVGAAIRAFHTSPSSKKWLSGLGSELKKAGATIGHAAAFVTHGLSKEKANGWGKRFRRKVEKANGIQAVYPDWLSGKVMGQEGPLEDGAEERFRKHADELRDWAGLK